MWPFRKSQSDDAAGASAPARVVTTGHELHVNDVNMARRRDRNEQVIERLRIAIRQIESKSDVNDPAIAERLRRLNKELRQRQLLKQISEDN